MGMRPSSNPDGDGGSYGGHTGGESKVEVFTRWGEITGLMVSQADLWTYLQGLAPLGHTHTWGSITNRATSLDGYGIEDAVRAVTFADAQVATTAALATKATTAALDAALVTVAGNLSAGLAGLETSLNASIATKASIASVTAVSDALALKAGIAYVDAGIVTVNASIATKTDTTYVDAAIATAVAGAYKTSNLSFGAGLSYAGGVLTATAAAVVWGAIGGSLANQTDLTTALAAKMDFSGGTFTGHISVPSDVYSPSWNGNFNVPTKDDLYDKIQALTIAAGAGIADGDYGDVLFSGSGTVATVQTVGGVAPSLVGHVHVIADTTGLQGALDAKAATGHNHDATYALIAHAHAIADVTGLQAALDSKAATGSYQALDSTLTALAALDGTAGILEQTGVDTFVRRAIGVTTAVSLLTRADGDGRFALLGHTHTGDFAPAVHTHTISAVTGLQAALDLKLEAADITGKADKFDGTTSASNNTTLSDTSHNKKCLTMTGATTRTITGNATPSTGFSTLIHNTGSVAMTLSCASGVYKNGSTTTATSGSIPAGGVVTVFHKGAGVYIARGDIT